jgi:hypothetical protein
VEQLKYNKYLILGLIPFNKVAVEEATENKDDDNDEAHHIDHLYSGPVLKECHT